MRTLSNYIALLILTYTLTLLQPPCLAQEDFRTDDMGNPFPGSWLDTLKSTWNEVRNVSPLACIFIMLPVTLCFLFCGCVTCICVKCSKSSQRRTSSSSRIVVKSPDGQLDPIPLTGLVHHNKSKSQMGFQPLRPVVGHPTSAA